MQLLHSHQFFFASMRATTLKTLLLSMAMIALCISVSAQDKIYKIDGDIVEAKIKSVGVKTIVYQVFNNQTGPEYTIEKTDVQKIVYQNGSEDIFNDARRLPYHHTRGRHTHFAGDATAAAPAIHYKPDVLALAPLQFSENGLGVGISYERALDKDGFIAFYLPAILTWNLNNGTYVNSNNQTVNGNADMMFYAMPGIKIYPTGSYGPVRYAVGPSLVIASGQKSSNTSTYDPNTGYTISSNEVTQQHFLLGLMINNSLNINPGPHVYLGLELGLGFTYVNRVGGLNQDTEFLAQGGFKIGYRF